MSNDAMRRRIIQLCQICGLPTITEFGFTCCIWCLKFLCVNCRFTHPEKCDARTSPQAQGPGQGRKIKHGRTNCLC